MASIDKNRIPDALFKTSALFNPYQYLPFLKIFEYKDNSWQWNGKNLAIYDDSGSGKTLEVIYILREFLKKNPDNFTALIISHERTHKQWYNELKKAGIYSAENNLFSQQITVISHYKDLIDYKIEQEINSILPESIDLIIIDDAQEISAVNGFYTNNYNRCEKIIESKRKKTEDGKYTGPVICMIYWEEKRKAAAKKLADSAGDTVTNESRQADINCFTFNPEDNIISTDNKEEDLKAVIKQIFEKDDKVIVFCSGDDNRKRIERAMKEYSVYCAAEDITSENSTGAKKGFEKNKGKAVLVFDYINARPLHDIKNCYNIINFDIPINCFQCDIIANLDLLSLERPVNIYSLCETEEDKQKVIKYNYGEAVEHYIKTEKEVKEKLFGIDDDTPMKRVLEMAEEAVIGSSETRFCGYMYKTPSKDYTENVYPMPLSEYQKQFKGKV